MVAQFMFLHFIFATKLFWMPFFVDIQRRDKSCSDFWSLVCIVVVSLQSARREARVPRDTTVLDNKPSLRRYLSHPLPLLLVLLLGLTNCFETEHTAKHNQKSKGNFSLFCFFLRLLRRLCLRPKKQSSHRTTPGRISSTTSLPLSCRSCVKHVPMLSMPVSGRNPPALINRTQKAN